MGGGETHYLPSGTVGRFGREGIREDGRNLIAEAQAGGYQVVYSLEELQNLPADTEKVLRIFAAEDTYNARPEAELKQQGLTPCATFKKNEKPIKKNEKVENNLNHQGWLKCSIRKSLSLRCFAV